MDSGESGFGPLRAYARFVPSHYLAVIIAVAAITLAATILSANVTTKSMDYKDMVPEGIEVMQTMNLISDAFGGTSSAMVVIQLDPRYANSTEIRDLRDHRAIQYMDALTSVLERGEDAIDVSSPSASLKALNGGVLPKSDSQIRALFDANPSVFARSVSPDSSVAVVSVRLTDSADPTEVLSEMNLALSEVPAPPGLNASITGEPIQSTVVNQQISPDMARTSGIAFIGIVAISILVFGSVSSGLAPLTTIVIGVIWVMGFLGLMHSGLSAMTSGAISMIMGIGIDFGIQFTMRFKSELASSGSPEPAMEKTICATFFPMLTTTLAALIGFQAMSLGQLKMIGELGTMMSYGVVACFLVAMSFVPAFLMLFEKHSIRKFVTHKRRRKSRQPKPA
jgi:predicted RND superfamily exporter protein